MLDEKYKRMVARGIRIPAAEAQKIIAAADVLHARIAALERENREQAETIERLKDAARLSNHLNVWLDMNDDSPYRAIRDGSFIELWIRKLRFPHIDAARTEED